MITNSHRVHADQLRHDPKTITATMAANVRGPSYPLVPWVLMHGLIALVVLLNLGASEEES